MTKSTITREQAEEAIDGLEGLISRGVQSVYLDIAIAGLRQLVPAMDQKPALHRYRRKAVEPYGPYPWHYEVFVDYPQPFEDIEDEYFYAAPPVVTGFAVDGESECLPLDYLQGHKDGLEFASQLAEANHPETGDWLYDDPIELAKAIRKGPDMPPAQPAPVVPEEMTPEMMRSVQLNSELGAYAASNLSGAYDLFSEFWKVACRAAMLAAAPHDTPALNSVQSVVTVPGKWIPVSEQKPDCWCLTCRPVTLNDMRFVVCPDCGNKRCPRANDHRNACTGSNEPGQEGSAYPAAPQSPGNEPATVPGKWIPVSEKMPPSRHEVLVGRWWGEKPRWCCKWSTYIPGHPDAQSSGWLIPGASWTPTHWMPLPAAPQEVKGE